MLNDIVADIVVVIHFGFVLFAVLGGILLLRWRFLAWIHLPCVFWAAVIEFSGWVCPLTPLENWLRERGGKGMYDPGFVEHYLFPVLYPEGLTRDVQIALGILVIIVNLGIYLWVFRQRAKRKG